MTSSATPRGRRIAIVDPSGYLDTVSVLCDLAEALAEDGWAVDIYTESSPEYSPPVFEHGLIRLRTFPPRPSSPKKLRLEALAEQDGKFAPVVRALAMIHRKAWALSVHARRALYTLRLDVWSIRLRLQQRRLPHRLFIGVDMVGLVRAAELDRFVGAPLAYHSLEILLRAEITAKDEMRSKHKEIELTRRAEFVIIQDEERAQVLAAENGIPPEKFVFVPNAPIGPAHRSDSRYWHEMFGLPETTKVLLHAGDVGVWNGIEGIVRSAADLPEGWVLVVHTKYDAECSSSVASLVEMADKDKVFFSLKPVPRQAYGNLVDSADAGVVFYWPMPISPYHMTNIRVIGLSSGKVANYLRAGLPVVANSACTLGALAEQEGFGVSVDHESELGAAVGRIAADYEGYSERARVFFDTSLDFRIGSRRILDRIRAEKE
jgi:glycosyltransferase involved in cell wall biosynthesis